MEIILSGIISFLVYIFTFKLELNVGNKGLAIIGLIVILLLVSIIKSNI